MALASMITPGLAALALGAAAIIAPTTRGAGAPSPPGLAEPGPGLLLWGSVRIGMSVGEVRRLYPVATTPPAPRTLTGGEQDLLQLAGVRLAGRAATAHVFFKRAQVVSVELTLDHLPAGASARNLGEARQIAQSLGARYGQAYDCGDASADNIDAYECKWLSGRLSVRMWYMDVAGQQPLFYVAYRQAGDPGYNL